jgi:hypothetical protein
LLCNVKLDKKRLRTAFVVYGALNRKDGGQFLWKRLLSTLRS